MKTLDNTNLGYLLTKIKNAFIRNTDVESVSEISIEPVSEITVDSTPTANSNNLVTSGGVYTKLEDVAHIDAQAGTPASLNIESTLNKVTTISDQSTDVQYPSAKAVNDAFPNVMEQAKILALRALYFAADRRSASNVYSLKFNDTGEDIVRTTDWGDVVHKAGCYWLNGVGDITEDEMLKIYTYANPDFNLINHDARYSTDIYLFENCNCKTNLNYSRVHWNTGIPYASAYYYYYGLKVAFLGNNNPQYISAFRGFGKTNNKTLEAIIPTLDVSALTGTDAAYNSFYDTNLGSSFKYVKMTALKISCSIFRDCPLLMFECVQYLIQNAANTSAITVTLHATTYATCQADTTEYTYESQTYTGIIAYAAARSISIVSA